MIRYEITQTSDGSLTIKDYVVDETFHSVAGARSESMHVFIENGLFLFKEKSSLSIFEMGFGTGLNALLTAMEKPKYQHIYYETIELYPLPNQIMEEINNHLFSDFEKDLFRKIWQCRWGINCELPNDFILCKKVADIRNYTFDRKFDLVYYDAFSFKSQPDLWTTEIFKNIYSAMNYGACLVTYACNGQLKTNLKNAGFEVKRLAGAPPKHHMTVAVKR